MRWGRRRGRERICYDTVNDEKIGDIRMRDIENRDMNKERYCYLQPILVISTRRFRVSLVVCLLGFCVPSFFVCKYSGDAQNRERGEI